MKSPIKTRICFLLLALLMVGLLYACGNPATSTTLPTEGSTDQPEATIPSAQPSESSEVSPGSDESIALPDRVDLVYFHSPQRCNTCVYIEERVVYVVETYFQDEIDSGHLTFKILDLGDKDNAAIARKYGAVSSQLFINVIADGVDHIRHIKEVWFRDYLKDKEVFDEVISGIIEQSLNGVY